MGFKKNWRFAAGAIIRDVLQPRYIGHDALHLALHH